MNPTFKGELMLAGWSETHNGGAKVTFWLPDPTELDAFKPLTIAKGKTAGHRFMAVLVEIGDDEQPKDDAKIIEAAKGGELERLSGILCNTPDFQTWLRETFPDDWMAEASEKPGTCIDTDITARILRRVCFVQSRAELDHNARAAELFHTRIRRPYMEHCGK